MEVSYGVVYVAPASLVNHLALRGETDTWWPPPGTQPTTFWRMRRSRRLIL